MSELVSRKPSNCNSWDRLRLKPQKMEVIESLGSWLREGLIKPNCLNSMGLSTEAVTGDENEAEQNASDDEMEISTFLELYRGFSNHLHYLALSCIYYLIVSRPFLTYY